jgi:ParB/RepB/Spo0J family partition protein
MAAALKLTVGKVFFLPIKKIHADPNQPRKVFDADALKDLAANIKARGVEHPILVRIDDDGKILIKDGERRWRATQLAKLNTIPVLLAGKDDATSVAIDQVTLNQHHEKLAPMELARWLVRLREEHKLTPTEIAKRLEKEGLRAMSRSHVANLMRLVDLPKWAEALLNEGKIDTSAARSILSGKDSSKVMDYVKQEVQNRIQWHGRATVGDIERAVGNGYDQNHLRLSGDCWSGNEEQQGHVPHFDYKKVCSGCEHLKVIDKTPYCLNGKLFKEHNDKAKAEGLGPLGKKEKTAKPAAGKKPTAAQVRSEEKRKAAEREGSLETKSRDYLHTFWKAKLREAIGNGDLSRIETTVIDFWLLGSPGECEYRTDQKAQRNRIALNKIALKYKHESIAHLINEPTKPTLYIDLARAIIDQLEWEEVQDLAHGYFGKKLKDHWKLDAAYLDLLRKNELAQIAKANDCADAKEKLDKMKQSELKDLILKLCQDLPPPALLDSIYLEKNEREPLATVLIDEDEADEAEDDR